MEKDKAGEIAVFLYSINSDAEVFHLITVEESQRPKKVHPYKVYWQSKKNNVVYGPFINVYSAMEHFALLSQPTNASVKPKGPPTTATVAQEDVLNVINVDFKARRRI